MIKTTAAQQMQQQVTTGASTAIQPDCKRTHFHANISQLDYEKSSNWLREANLHTPSPIELATSPNCIHLQYFGNICDGDIHAAKENGFP